MARETKQQLNDEENWRAVREWDENRQGWDYPPKTKEKAGFGCFLIGVTIAWLALYGLFKLVEGLVR